MKRRPQFTRIEGDERARVARLIADDARHAERAAEAERLGPLKRPAAPANPRAGDFVRDRVLEKRAGAKKGWRKRTPLQAAFEKGQLNGGARAHAALERYEAGQRYAQLFAACEKSGGRDSTDMDRISAGGGAGRDLPPTQLRALKRLAAIEARLSANDRRIVRGVCGWEEKPSVVICALNPDYRDRVSARLCEALDSLVEAEK